MCPNKREIFIVLVRVVEDTDEVAPRVDEMAGHRDARMRSVKQKRNYLGHQCAQTE